MEEIADELGSRYAWTPVERRRHMDRMYDVRQTQAMDDLNYKSSAPLIRSPEAIDELFAELDRRAVAARRHRLVDEQ